MLSDTCFDFGLMAKKAGNKPLARLKAMRYLLDGCEHYGDPSHPVQLPTAIVEMLKGACAHYYGYPCDSNWKALRTIAEAVRIHLDSFPIIKPLTDEQLQSIIDSEVPKKVEFFVEGVDHSDDEGWLRDLAEAHEWRRKEAREALETRRAWRAAA
jgi:hypothetical protein